MNGYGIDTRRWIAGTLALAATLTLAACGPDESSGAPREANVVVLAPSDVATAEIQEISGGVVLTGTLNPYRIAEVKAQVPGTVATLNVDRGDAVQSGQTLAVIRAEGIQGQAQGAAAAVAAAEAGLALAQQQLESARVLHEAGAISDLDYRAAQTQHESARAQLASARAQAAGAGEQARNATVTAPISGEVSDRQVNHGEAVSPGQTLFTVVNSTRLELAGQVPVAQATQVRAGLPVEFTMNAYPGRVFRGEVARVEPVADPQTRQVGVYIQLPNENRQLVGGLFATGRIATGASTESVVVPTSAIREAGAQAYVMVVAEGVVARRDVTLGVRDEAAGVVAIESGLQGGEQVIVAPGQIQEGVQVRIGGSATPSPTAEEENDEQ